MIPVLLIGHFQGHFINAHHSHTTPIHPDTLASGANSEKEIALKSRAMVDHVLWTIGWFTLPLMPDRLRLERRFL